MPIAMLRRLRHGKLRFLGSFWLVLGRLYRRALGALPRRGTVKTKIGPYGPFKLDAMFAFSDFEHWGRGHNDAFATCIEACRGKSCVIDVGAHIGLVALPVSSVLAAGGRLYCFEPGEANRSCLEEHLRNNGCSNTEVLPWLVGPQPEPEARFYELDEPSGMNTIVSPREAGRYRETRRRQVSLDSFCDERGLAPQVIKIDVEGAEIGVLRGARNMIWRDRPLIVLSVHPREIAGSGESLLSLTALIDELGYRCTDSRGHPPERFELREYILRPA